MGRFEKGNHITNSCLRLNSARCLNIALETAATLDYSHALRSHWIPLPSCWS